MAKLYYAADGTIVRLLKSDTDERMFPDAPPNTTVLEFDTDTNAPVIAGLDTDWNSHRVVNGALQRNGQAVTIAAPGPAAAERVDLQRILDKINAGTSLTADDVRRALRPVLRDRVG